ncbi:hypothetical protein G5C51_36420 [Streptomyces sp. A7024]|uniref:Carbohydrate kinase PfkB domain-containing protein n=1 Tax=Streptomyces coryli TaxID=1128680 RepID=A0A6G4UCB9_9ACTN|nr:PfkB family carbohydrate kinase [Streptomyces coryli]NGN69360.1 hypothetical protein [Streptomyces coryli]
MKDRRGGGVLAVGPVARDITVLIDALPGRGDAARVREFCIEAGGKGANPAVAVAALGTRVALLGQIGADEAGAAARRELTALGVDVSPVEVTPDRPTGHIVHLVEPGGRRRYVEAAGATELLSPAADTIAARCADHAYVLLSTAVREDTATTVCRVAHEHGATVIVDGSGDPGTVAAVLEHTHVLRCDATEAAALADRPVTDFGTGLTAARHLRGRGPGTVIVGAGADGDVVVGDEGLELRLPHLPVRSVNPTGGGDALIGALTALLAQGFAVADAAPLASAAAADTVARLGARPRFDRATLEDLAVRPAS